MYNVYSNYSSIEKLFMKYYNESGGEIKSAITKFSNYFINFYHDQFSERASQGVKFMFPNPDKGSACKRINLFMRWMVRKDDLDLGLWKNIPASKLIIPVDTHVSRIAYSLKLTRRRNVSWKMAEEITDKLKRFDANDPVKYDFALCHIGIRKLLF
jgi:uncharacterized protein (TIGR02757 family)